MGWYRLDDFDPIVVAVMVAMVEMIAGSGSESTRGWSLVRLALGQSRQPP